MELQDILHSLLFSTIEGIINESTIILEQRKQLTRPAWAGFKTAEEGRAKICKFLWQKL
jgi:hypothetical protein